MLTKSYRCRMTTSIFARIQADLAAPLFRSWNERIRKCDYSFVIRVIAGVLALAGLVGGVNFRVVQVDAL